MGFASACDSYFWSALYDGHLYEIILEVKITLEPFPLNQQSCLRARVCLFGIWPYSLLFFLWDRYGAPYNTEYKVTVENLSSRASWQVRIPSLSSFNIVHVFKVCVV